MDKDNTLMLHIVIIALMDVSRSLIGSVKSNNILTNKVVTFAVKYIQISHTIITEARLIQCYRPMVERHFVSGI